MPRAEVSVHCVLDFVQMLLRSDRVLKAITSEWWIRYASVERKTNA